MSKTSVFFSAQQKALFFCPRFALVFPEDRRPTDISLHLTRGYLGSDKQYFHKMKNQRQQFFIGKVSPGDRQGIGITIVWLTMKILQIVFFCTLINR
jgi:hypothetical protein